MRRVRAVGAVVLAALLVFALLAGFALWPPQATAPARQPLVLEGVTVVNPGRSRVSNQRLETVDGRISSLGPGSESGPYAGAFVVPGLVDMHSHYPPSVALGMRETSSLLALVHGVTTVRDTGEVGSDVLDLRGRIERGELPGPRIFACGPVIDGDPPVHTLARVVRNSAEARVVADELADAGVDCLKVYHNLSPGALRAVRERGAVHGLPVLGHVPEDVPIGEVGLADSQHLFGIAEARPLESFHGTWARWDDVDDDAMEEVVRVSLAQRMAHTPTLVTFSRLAELQTLQTNGSPLQDQIPGYLTQLLWGPRGVPAAWGLDAENLAVLDRALPKMRELVRRMYESGVRLHVGSDCFMPYVLPGRGLWGEMAEFVAAGLTPEQTWELATRRAGEFLGRPGLGELAPGAPADLLVFREDPTRDLAALATLELVVADGRVYTREDLEVALARYRDYYAGIGHRLLDGLVSWLLEMLV